MAKKRSKTEKPPPIDKLIVPAIGIVIAFVGYYFFKGISTDITRIDVGDELAIREVFFGEGEGKNYAVLCNTVPKEGSKGVPISSVFQDALAEGAPAEFVLMDCEALLPSGKSVAQRFKLDLKKRPTVFVSGKVGPPKQIPDKHLRTGHLLTKLLKSMLEPHAAKIENTKDFKSKCLNKPICGLLLKGGPPQPFVKHAVKNLLDKYQDVQFASVDSTVLLLSNLEEYIPEFQKGEHRFVVFKKISGGLEEKDGRLITSIIPLENDSISYESMAKIVKAAINDTKPAKKLPALPQVKTRSKKLEEQERKKRERSQTRKEEGAKPKTTPGGQFQANDGSKEGRKAERDRRREEHRKAQNIKEKTPEEIAEMERMRRQRMDEEAAKWNIGSEDAPPEGDPVDDSQDYFMGDEEVGEEGGEGSYDEDEDEDVLDLD